MQAISILFYLLAICAFIFIVAIVASNIIGYYLSEKGFKFNQTAYLEFLKDLPHFETHYSVIAFNDEASRFFMKFINRISDESTGIFFIVEYENPLARDYSELREKFYGEFDQLKTTLPDWYELPGPYLVINFKHNHYAAHGFMKDAVKLIFDNQPTDIRIVTDQSSTKM